MRIHFASIVSGIIIFTSCKPDNVTPVDCPSGIVSFSAQVQPIINQNCNVSGCHGFLNEAPFQLMTHQQVDSAVIYTNLLLSIKHQSPVTMPRIDPLLPDAYMMSDSVIQIIECWINQGRQNN
ncbi:MAG: hypothetical protein ACK47F_02185 [Flavobacteriales bacterium]